MGGRGRGAGERGGVLGGGGQEEHRHFQAGLAHPPQHAIAVEAGKHQVEYDEIGLGQASPREALGSVVGDVDFVSLDLQVVAQAVGEIGIVLHDQDSLHGLSPFEPSCGRGSSITIRAPAPALPSMWARPPCSSTSSRTTASPIPAPATGPSWSRGSRTYRCQTRSRCASGMPGPSSSIQRRTTASVVEAQTTTFYPAATYHRSFSITLMHTWRRAFSSASTSASAGTSLRTGTSREAALRRQG